MSMMTPQNTLKDSLARVLATTPSADCHTKHRYDCLDFDFFAEIAKCGLLLEEVRAKGVPTPSPSPPPFEHLFNEFRIAVYKITKLPS